MRHFLALVDPETVFDPIAHARVDMVFFEFTLAHEEAHAPTLKIDVQNPGIGLLAPGRRVWAWFSRRDDAGVIRPLFYGRLVSVPDDLMAEVLSLSFVAQPIDVLTQKRELAAAMRNRPWHDDVWVDVARRSDPDVVLEGRSAVWHFDRVTLQVTASDVVNGEDGIEIFQENDSFYDNLKFVRRAPPLRSISVDATVSWEQQDVGVMPLGGKVITSYAGDGLISDWPKSLTSLGGGWSVASSSAIDVWRVSKAQMHSSSYSWQNKEKKHNTGDQLSTEQSVSVPILPGHATGGGFLPGGTGDGPFVSEDGAVSGGWSAKLSFSSQTGFIDPDTGMVINPYIDVNTLYVLKWLVATSISVRYEARRARTENIRFTMFADLQAVVTDSGDAAADFAQDSELLTLSGKVGLEIPFGRYRGDWQPHTRYELFDYVTILGGKYAYFIVRAHWSQGSFNPNEVLGLPIGPFLAGDKVGGGVSGYRVMIDWNGGFNPLALGPDGELVFSPTPAPPAAGTLYRVIPHFRGHWQPGVVYVAGDIFFAPDGHTYRTLIGHTSAATFDPLESDVAIRFVYGLLLNPPPIGYVGRRSYFPLDPRGRWSLENLLARARARLRFRARCINISFDCRIERAETLSCRKNARIYDPRLPGGTAEGKIIAYSMKGNGDNQTAIGNVTIGCTVGQGNLVTAQPGFPTYVKEGYVKKGYQQYTDEILVMPDDDVGYSVPLDLPEDDGLVFPLTRGQAVISEIVQNPDPHQVQQAFLAALEQDMANQITIPDQAELMARNAKAMAEALVKNPTWYELILAPVTNGPFASEYDLKVTHLTLPKTIDLAAPSVPQ